MYLTQSQYRIITSGGITTHMFVQPNKYDKPATDFFF